MVSEEDLIQRLIREQDDQRGEKSILVLAGPTACGKTTLALELARRLRQTNQEVEIINADSILIYKYFNIGSAKPPKHELKEFRHHLIDIVTPSERFTLGDYVRAVKKTIQEVLDRGHHPLIVGGTGFYIKGLLYGIWEGVPKHSELRKSLEADDPAKLYDELFKHDPKAALRIGRNDKYRLIRAIEILRETGKTPSELEAQQSQTPDPRYRLIVLDRDKQNLESRVQTRLRQMLKAGWVEETEQLMRNYPQARALGAVGYRQISDYLSQKKPQGRKIREGLVGLEDEIFLATKQLIKRQRTWFRSEKAAEHVRLDSSLSNLQRHA